MAIHTVLAEVIGGVIGIGGPGKVRLVTAETVGGGVHIPLIVAGNTVQGNMRPGEREVRIIMVEVRIIPISGVVTIQTIVAEVIGHVVGIVCIFKIDLMAAVAVVRGIGIALIVAVDTIDRDMRAGQRKIGQIMVEVGRLPGVFAVADRAFGGKTVGHMVRITGVVEVGLMAADAVTRQTGYLSPNVAGLAESGGMGSPQLEAAGLQVVKNRPLPAHLVMAGGAFGGETGLGVIGKFDPVVIDLMAGVTIVGGTGITVLVAPDTIGLQVSPAQFEGLGMLVGGSLPAHRGRAVAAFAIEAEISRFMAGVFGHHIIAHVAGITINVQSGEFALVGGIVAGLAIHAGMHTGKRETLSSVKFQNFELVIPAVRGVAALAIQPKLGLVNVGMATGAFRGGRFKVRGFVTGVTFDIAVAAVQGKAGFLMAEIHGIAHFVPTGGGMAGLALPLERPVGILTGLPEQCPAQHSQTTEHHP